MDFKPQVDTKLYDELEGLSDSSRLWIWQSPKALDQNQVDKINTILSEFVPRWASHSRQLIAKSLVLYDRFVVVALDQEVSHDASGCSIDSLTQVITNISQEINIDLLDRTHFCFKEDVGLSCIHMNELSDHVASGSINENSLVFNTLVSSKKDLLTKWLLPIGESWHKRFM